MSDAATLLSRQRCFHHPAREAVCLCTGCSQSYCRECVVEHDGRLICATCLQKETSKASVSSRTRIVRTWAFALAGFAAAWAFFYMSGTALLAVITVWDNWRSQ